MNGIPAKPWYREPWPWILMAGPGLVIVAGIATAFLAVMGDDGLVAGDYYRQGVSINRTLGRDQRARELAVTAVVQLAASRDRIRVSIAGKASRTASITLSLVHATRSGQDQAILLVAMPDGSFEGSLRQIGSGPWRAILDDERNGWRLSGAWPTGHERFELKAAP